MVQSSTIITFTWIPESDVLVVVGVNIDPGDAWMTGVEKFSETGEDAKLKFDPRFAEKLHTIQVEQIH